MTKTALALALTAPELTRFLLQAFDGLDPAMLDFERFEPGFLRMRQVPDSTMLRPGGIVSGPTQMALVDRAAYAIVLAHIGIVPMAVTSNLNISFLRGLRAEPFYADASLIKLGRRLATIDVRLWQDRETQLAAQSTVTYALPES